MKFRTGKYAGLTIEHVRKFDPKYIRWISENRPEMLRERINNPIKVNKPAKKYNDFEGLDIKSKAKRYKGYVQSSNICYSNINYNLGCLEYIKYTIVNK